ncbi:putative membrane protein [Escherichia coli 2-052-05_S4_C1]|nr:putative membrane protein [Escherichia coli 2-052-05_S4_C1]
MSYKSNGRDIRLILLLCFCLVPDVASTVFLMIHMKGYFIDLLPF